MRADFSDVVFQALVRGLDGMLTRRFWFSRTSRWTLIDAEYLRVSLQPFGRLDTNALEEAFKASPSEPGSCRTDGGRFVVDIAARTRTPLFWEQEASKVVRALW